MRSQQVRSTVADTFLNHHIQPLMHWDASHKLDTPRTALLQGWDRSPATSQHEAAATGTERAGRDSPLAQGGPSNTISQPWLLHIHSAAKIGWPIQMFTSDDLHSLYTAHPARRCASAKRQHSLPAATLPGSLSPCSTTYSDLGQGVVGSQIPSFLLKVLQGQSPD